MAANAARIGVGALAARLGTAAVTAVLLVGCGTTDTPAPSTPTGGQQPGRAAQNASPLAGPPAPGNPLVGRPFFVDGTGPAATQAAQWEADRAADAAELRKIADRPAAQWIGGEGDVTSKVDAVVGRAAAKGQLPLLVAYNIPHRDCGNFSAGGAGSSDEYRAWIHAFAAGVKGRPVIVVLEPDAVAHAVEGCNQEPDRLALLAEAVSVLKSTGKATVYIDAGNPRWITDVKRLATALQQAGVATADGFALNVANFITTTDNVTYGNAVSDALGGKTHFVVDTSRNGAGPVPGNGDINGGPRWCNPPDRLLGQAPTIETGQPRLDALLWVKRPGESDGACRPGEPEAGEWWPDYALSLAKRS
ncbi:glycoside hydrolase family 6 protein [Dactylosporangium sucinum]|uniref:Glucanase n=1 Tax=Dactylosporangium sucinum TaxID=1424081 RepID=A0A917UEV0_9ACTN|nr:glycoside hydrolase family 6 protein [Dactylosporangium sucinum]GGM80164.1 glucanase [Dactylosporangium sucinum]